MKGAVWISKYLDMHGCGADILAIGHDSRARCRGFNEDIVSHGVVGTGFRAGGKRSSATGQKCDSRKADGKRNSSFHIAQYYAKGVNAQLRKGRMPARFFSGPTGEILAVF